MKSQVMRAAARWRGEPPALLSDFHLVLPLELALGPALVTLGRHEASPVAQTMVRTSRPQGQNLVRRWGWHAF